jgi:hypothetical protein
VLHRVDGRTQDAIGRVQLGVVELVERAAQPFQVATEHLGGHDLRPVGGAEADASSVGRVADALDVAGALQAVDEPGGGR